MENENTLKKYFKAKPEDFKKYLTSVLNSENTIKLNFFIKNNQAFFHYDPLLFEKAIEIEKKDVTLKATFDSLPPIAKTQYIRNTLVAEVKNTNELEGVFSSRRVIFELTEDLKKRQSDKIGSIVSKYLMLLDGGEKEVASCRDIRNIYDELFNLDGKSLIIEKDKPDGMYFRKGFVGVFDLSGKLIHPGVPGENNIIELIQEGLKILNDKSINLYFRIALFHYIFEYAHPFYDGNGRLGRYLVSLFLKKERCDIFAFRVSSGFNQRKSKYYKAFEKTEDPRNYADLNTFVYDFLDLLSEEYTSSIDYAEKKKKEMYVIDEKFSKDSSYTKNEKRIISILIQAYVFSDFGINIKELESITKLSSKTIRRCLDKLDQKGILFGERRGKYIYYNLSLNE